MRSGAELLNVAGLGFTGEAGVREEGTGQSRHFCAALRSSNGAPWGVVRVLGLSVVQQVGREHSGFLWGRGRVLV